MLTKLVREVRIGSGAQKSPGKFSKIVKEKEVARGCWTETLLVKGMGPATNFKNLYCKILF